MTTFDRITRLQSYLKYVSGSFLAKIVLKKVGKQTLIHLSVKYVHPSKIIVGDNCEIRHGCFFDARSDKVVCIRIGDGTRIKDMVGFATYGGEIFLGRKVLIGRCCTIFGHGGVFIGDNTMIGQNSVIISSNHVTCLADKPFQEQGFTRERIEIGDNVWIGANVTILAGCTIASNVVIGAGSVVKGNLETGWIYGGVPAKPLNPLETQIKNDINVYYRDWNLYG